MAVKMASFLGVTLVVLYVWQRHVARVHHRRIAEHMQGNRGGPDRPIAQHPQINPYRCVSCGSCVNACPEHGVLAVVQGRAQLVNPSGCVGHGYCEYACPVGALTVGLGDTSDRTDLPILTPELETSVPGVFIAGELGGIALIRHAVEQGSSVMDVIHRRLKADGVGHQPSEALDVLIVGCGPAGISACLKATERGLRCAVIDQDDLGGAVRKYPRNKLTMTEPVHLPMFGRMKRAEYTKEELLELWEGIFQNVGIEVGVGLKFTTLNRLDDGTLCVQTSGGSFRCRYLVLAMGRRGTPRRLGVPGEESEKVLYQLIDAADHNDEGILVVGGGDSAIEAAGVLAAQPGNRATLSYRREAFFRLKQKNLQWISALEKRGQVRVVLNSQVTRIEDGRATMEIRRAGETEELTVPADYVYVSIGGEPPTGF